MKPCSKPPFELALARHGVFTIPDATGIAIECLAGSVWITIEGELRDIVLEPGERFQGDTHRKVLVWALTAASVRVFCARLAILPGTVTAARRWLPRLPIAAGLAT